MAAWSYQVVRYKDFFASESDFPNLPLPAYGTNMRFRVIWNAVHGGYDVMVQINGVESHLGRAAYNKLRPWFFQVGSEANHCDGNDGDTQYNFISPHYTSDWDWYDDDYQIHPLSANDPLYWNPPAHFYVTGTGRTQGCFHMNTTAPC